MGQIGGSSLGGVDYKARARRAPSTTTVPATKTTRDNVDFTSQSPFKNH
jgi:hypothetical protein